MDDLISRKAAIDAVENIDCSDGVGISALKCEAVDDGVTAIKALPSAQPEKVDTPTVDTPNCDDTISRQAAVDALNVGAELLRRVLDDADIVGAERAKYEWGLGLIESYISDMKEIPSAQPDKDMIHLQKEQAYMQGWEEGRNALREEIWENERDRLD